MSETDSFITEVSEEVRRDKLFVLMRKYGWIGILAVLLLVGWATYNEWAKARDMAAAQKFGDSLLQALELDDSGARAQALAKVGAGDAGAQSLLAMLQAANAQAAGDKTAATAALAGVADDATQIGRASCRERVSSPV